jgi:arginine:ornithine antiporter/lysine permease
MAHEAGTQTGRARPVTVSMPTLTAMVVGSMVGAGVFSLPRRFAQETGVTGALVSWVVAGSGMLMLALVFRNLSMRRPDLDAGVYAYAKAGFGELTGFFSAAGYWASACVGNVTYWVLIMSTLGAWVPALGAGDTVLAVVVSSAGLWCFFLLVRRGIREATAINRIVTVAKLVPIVVFVLVALLVLDPAVFRENLTGADYTGSLFEQVRSTMLVTVFVFLGVEGASVYSRYARRREDIGRATVLGLLSVLSIFASVTVVSYGVLPMSEIAELRQPSMAGVLEAAVGEWGSVFVSVGLVVSVPGAYLAWTLMAAEVLFVAAQDRDMPRFLARQSDRSVPVNALLLSTALSQVVLVVTYFSEDAFDFALDLTAVTSLVPYLLAAAYAVRLWRADRAETPAPRSDLVVAAVATAYTVFLLFAAGLDLLLMSFVLYAPLTVLFAMTRREQGRRVLERHEVPLFSAVVAVGLVGVVALAAGWISL